MKAYSEDLRLRVLAALDGGMSRADAVHTFRVSLSSLKRWCAQRTVLGHLRPKRPTGRPRTITRNLEARLRVQLDAAPDATLSEQLSTWSRDQGSSLSRWTLSRSIKRLRWSRKKVSERKRARSLAARVLPGTDWRTERPRLSGRGRVRL